MSTDHYSAPGILITRTRIAADLRARGVYQRLRSQGDGNPIDDVKEQSP